MILVLRAQLTEEERDAVKDAVVCITGQAQLTQVEVEGRCVFVFDGAGMDRNTCAALAHIEAVDRMVVIHTSYKLVSRYFREASASVVVGNNIDSQAITIGDARETTIIAGPCAVESREQLFSIAQAVKEAGAHILRGGAFKPRTSPYQFQGMGVQGLALLREARTLTGLPVVTEVMEPGMVEVAADFADMLQIGSRNMQNYPLLRACGVHVRKLPILLKRGLSATIDEWLLAAEYIVAAGNPNVVLCERGIRSYDPNTRNVLDLTAVPLLHELTYLPVVVDPSHATGRSSLVPIMARASIAAGADGVMIEVHDHPEQALCDGLQAISPPQLSRIVQEAHVIRGIEHGRHTNIMYGQVLNSLS